jgi:hypothetical protein
MTPHTLEEVVSLVDAGEAADPKAAVVYHPAVAKEVDVGRRPPSVVPTNRSSARLKHHTSSSFYC